MGKSKTGLLIGSAVLIGVGGVLALTNPDQSAYLDYAVDQLEARAKQELCDQESQGLGRFFGNSCEALLEVGRSPARAIIASRTDRQNFVVFSLYRTDLPLDEMLPAALFDQPLPSYHVEAVGIFQQFFIYKAEEE